MIFGKKQDGKRFCSEECLGNFRYEGFCPDCVKETTDESSGNLSTVNGIGTVFLGRRHRCPVCYSAIRRQWFCLLYLPLIPLTAYRVKYNAQNVFFSRRVRPEMDKQVELRVQAGARR